jgi:hypothetical protein
LIAFGHPPADVWNYSPRQTAAFLVIAYRRREREMREQLAMQALAARGDPKAIQQALKDPP